MSQTPDSLVRHLNQNQLAYRWHVSPRSLERWRCFGGGPPFLKINGRILYRLDDVEAFEAAQRRMPAARRKHDAAADPDDPHSQSSHDYASLRTGTH